MSAFELPAAPTTADIVDHYDLAFDPGDKANGSLYLCTPPDGAAPEAAIEVLRAAGLWSTEPVRTVADDQRAAYRDGLEFVACAVFEHAAGELVAARFDHPKFPSDGARWQAWLDTLGEHHDRRR